jgi:hypothetical protein
VWVSGILGAVATSAASASGQTVGQITIEREPVASSGEEPYLIGYDDCVNNDTFIFTVPVVNGGTNTLKVVRQVGETSVDCSKSAVRADRPDVCKSLDEVNTAGNVELSYTVHQLLGIDGADQCGGDWDGTSIWVHFMLLDKDGSPPTSSGSYVIVKDIKVDVVGPPAPTGVEASGGEGKLLLTWDVSSDETVAGYRFYCDPARGQTTRATAPTVGVGGQAVEATGGATANAASNGGAGGTTPADEASGTGEDVPSSTSSTSSCSELLIAGEQPPGESHFCGSKASATATSGYATGLTDGIEHAVAVSAVDHAGNRGPLSEVKCATPREVIDFYEHYRAEGGGGGGGYCTVARGARSLALAAAIGSALLALLIRPRRSQRS